MKTNAKTGKIIGYILLIILMVISSLFLENLLLMGTYALLMDVLKILPQILMQQDIWIEIVVNTIMLGIYFGIYQMVFGKEKQENSIGLIPKYVGQSIVMGLGVAGISFLWLTFAEKIPSFSESMSILAKAEYAMRGLNPAIIILLFVILGPTLEELAFRGVIFRSLEKIKKGWFPIIVSALLFGLCHMIFVQSVYTFVFGLVAAIIYEKTRNILYPILCHMAINLMSAISGMIPKGIGEMIINIVAVIMIVPMGYFLYKMLRRTEDIQQTAPQQF